MDSLLRIFLTTAGKLVAAGQFQLLADYIALVARVLTAHEMIIVPGTPEDK